ncbi:MAG: hypothetical protein RIC55_09890 [Pirellulaceae bacterium]
MDDATSPLDCGARMARRLLLLTALAAILAVLVGGAARTSRGQDAESSVGLAAPQQNALATEGPPSLETLPQASSPAPLIVFPAGDAEYFSPFSAAGFTIDDDMLDPAGIAAEDGAQSDTAQLDTVQSDTAQPDTVGPPLPSPLPAPLATRPVHARCGDELWCISSRDLPAVSCIALDQPPPLRVWRQDPCSGRTAPSSLEEFFTHDDPGVITLIYVHGARVPESRAFARLPLIYQALVEHLPGDVRLRIVMYSWSNPKSIRVLNDFRIASAGAAPHGEGLAWLVSQIDPRVRVSLLSFSLGAQIVTRALDTLGSEENLPSRRRLRVVLWTAAESHQWIVPGGYHGRAIHAVDRLLLVMNTCDPMLKRFPLISPRTDPHALGYCGIDNLPAFGDDALRIRQIDAGAELGVSHGYRPHIEAPMVVAATRPYVFWQEVDGACPGHGPLETVSAAARSDSQLPPLIGPALAR